jgi:signal transduction histidine kinase
VTDLAQPDGTLVCIVHRPGALDDPGLRAGVDRALGLLLANRRLRAELADQLDAVERSRSRLVSADLAERSRLEAELDGGLGRRLDARTREIDAVLGSLTTGAMPGPSRRAPVVGSLALVRTEIRETRAELQALTRGRQPAAVPGGLAAALAMMAARCSIPVVVDAAAGPWHPTVEATVRFVVAEALTNVARHARATHASVALREVGHVVRVTIADDGIGGADPALGTGLHGIGARVGEAGGGWSLGAADGGGTRLTVELPAHPVGPPAAEAAA